MAEQFDLSAYLDHDPVQNTCCVIIDGECRDVTWAELFDSSKYDQLQCVTYVSTGSFYEKVAGKFDSVQIVIGIERGEVKRNFDESIRSRLHQEGSNLFSNASDATKNKIINRELVLRYSTADTIIHSKFYLLSNTESGENRVIIGSANLTESAFSNKVSQYEDVLVFNNSHYFDIYTRRFNVILGQTVDYVPEETLEKYKQGQLISVADLTAEEKTDHLLEIMKRENIIPVINEEILQQVQAEQDAEVRELTEIRASYEVISAVSRKSRKTGELTLKTPKELEDIKTKIVDIAFRGTRKEKELARFTLMFNDADKKQYRVFTTDTNEKSSRPTEVYDRKASVEEIRNSLKTIGKFTMAYHEFVSSPDPDNANLSHIFETILYAFSSAYIFRLRQETTPSRKTDIPIMLIIGGRASSGKSSLLAFIDALLSGRHLTREDHYIQYGKISGKRTLEDLFNSENTYPLLVDEVAPNFFNSKSEGKGEALIKYLANTLDGKHPVMICTTNTDTFSIPAQVARRVYYVQVDACFDENKKGEASDYYENVLASADNVLFRDFCCRMGDMIAHQDDLFGEGEFDYLYCARKIFRDYFSEIGTDIPEYFPEGLYSDYADRGREMWKVLFDRNKEMFNYKESGKTEKPELILNLKEIANGKKDSNVYMNYLRPDLLIEAAGLYTILRAEPFFEWIGVKNPWRKKSIWEKLLGK